MGCDNVTGLPDRHVKRDVKAREIVGMWRGTEESCNNLRNEGYHLHVKQSDHEIRFGDDGTCQVKTYAVFDPRPSRQEETRAYIMDQTGTWRLTDQITPVGHSSRSVRVVQIDLKHEIGECVATRRITLFLAEEGGKLVLWTYIGDPDYVVYQDYVKSGMGLAH